MKKVGKKIRHYSELFFRIQLVLCLVTWGIVLIVIARFSNELGQSLTFALMAITGAITGVIIFMHYLALLIIDGYGIIVDSNERRGKIEDDTPEIDIKEKPCEEGIGEHREDKNDKTLEAISIGVIVIAVICWIALTVL